MRIAKDRSGRPGGSTRARRTGFGVFAALAALAAVVTFGVGSPAGAADDTDSETTLTVPMDGSGVDTLNPFLSYYNGSLNAFGIIYPSLNSLDKEGKPGPYLAESWTTSDDDLTWTFKIASGLKWTDGEPITAEDAAWTLNLIMTNDAAATANGSLVANFESVVAEDDTTLVITTKKPQANMLYVSVPVSGIPIVPKHIWESHVADIDKFQNDEYPIVGYGPWTLTDYKTDEYQQFEANQDFALGDYGPPHFDNLVIQLFRTSDAAVAALKSGQIASTGVNSKQFAALEGEPNMSTAQTVGSGWTAVEINVGARTRGGTPIGTGSPLLTDPDVRTALHWAMDKQKLLTTVLGDQGVIGAGYLPPAWPQWFWVPSDEEKVTFDLDRANQILDDAGYPMGDNGIRVDPETGEEFSFRLGIHANDTTDAQVSQFLKGWYADIGVNLEIESMSFSKLNADLAKGDWDLLMDAWTTGPDPTYLLSIQTCGALPNEQGNNGSTDAFHCNPEYDKLFDQQVTELDPDKRVEIVQQMQQILYEDNADIIFFYGSGLSVTRDDLVQDLTYGTPDENGQYPSQSVFWNFLDAAPPAADAESSSSSGTTTAVLIGIAVVAALVIGGVIWRRRATKAERE